MTLTYCETCGEGYHDGMREVYISFSEDTVNITWACEFCAREFELEEKSEAAMQLLSIDTDSNIEPKNAKDSSSKMNKRIEKRLS